ncbi:MAG: undecaprenyl-diphosphatase [Firmicutes bacterium HGW-Firmicutes-14]|jgi:undecaprenyl-diphosphatase|nr:MAG: undecaprenyl-diphosphatase [Firmicutes bacterium HGW-Firmicutes-14]
MTVFQSVILGIIQGLTEFLPISSSGHLVLFQSLFGLKEGVLTFDVLVHLGTLAAVLAVFKNDILSILRKPWQRLTMLLVVATIPTGIIGLTFKDFFKNLFETGSSLGIEFIVTGLVIWFADGFKERDKDMDRISYFDAAFVGLMQGIAILPAISRSGLTIAGSLFRGINRETAARFSFLVSIPAIAGATVLDLKDIVLAGQGIPGGMGLPFLIGPVMAAISGYWAVKFMIRVLQRGSMKGFAYYVWALGVLVIILQLTGRL